ncbi:MAG TPA: DUF981 domain-containing protein [Rectinemataceae bacterium]|nr:DUF981 domain-containing protein [Rectinemataceae bacterium]
MFIDHLTIMLVNLAAGLTLMGIFVLKFMDKDRKRMAPGFLLSGFVSLVTSLHIVFTWPLPGSYNIAFGEMAAFFGVLFFVAGLAFLFDWDLFTLGIYAAFVGLGSIIIGARILSLNMTSEPLMAGGGFILTGLMAFLTIPVFYLRRFLLVRVLAAVGLFGSAAIWALTGFTAYWSHLAGFAKWAPVFMQQAAK